MRVVLILLSLVFVGVAAQAATPDPGGTPPFVPKTTDPRLFVTGNGQNEEVLALHRSGNGTFTQYNYEVPTGLLKQLRYDVTLTDSPNGGMALTFVRDRRQCSTYHAHFMDGSEQTLLVNGDDAPQWNGPRRQGCKNST
jgi:hypothetical protein